MIVTSLLVSMSPDPIFLLLLLSLLVCHIELSLSSTLRWTAEEQKRSLSDTYDCNAPCNNGDHHTLVASIETYHLLHKEKGVDEYFMTRTFHNGTFDPSSILGPSIAVKPGTIAYIKLRNEIDVDVAKSLNNKPPTIDDYLPFMDPEHGRYAGMREHGFPFTNTRTVNKSEINTDATNVPHDFNSVDLHVHGIQTEPHLFFPQGTDEPTADYIQVKPGQCYCYAFPIPDDHPTGRFWYHIHRHGAAAIQSWSGMAGLFDVVGDYQSQLKAKGIVHKQDFIVWDPHLQRLSEGEHEGKLTVKNMMGVGEFLIDQTDQAIMHLLVNDQIQPAFTQLTDETVLFQVLCATTENLVSFIVMDTDDTVVPFFVIAEDGINFAEPVKREALVLGGGQRADVLLQFQIPGKYRIVSRGLEHLQFFNTGPDDTTLASIDVQAAVPPQPSPNSPSAPTVSPSPSSSSAAAAAPPATSASPSSASSSAAAPPPTASPSVTAAGTAETVEITVHAQDGDSHRDGRRRRVSVSMAAESLADRSFSLLSVLGGFFSRLTSQRAGLFSGFTQRDQADDAGSFSPPTRSSGGPSEAVGRSETLDGGVNAGVNAGAGAAQTEVSPGLGDSNSDNSDSSDSSDDKDHITNSGSKEDGRHHTDTHEGSSSRATAATIAIPALRFRPGIPYTLAREEVTKGRTMIFDITADVRTIPFPQFRINRMSYNVSRINLEVNAGMTEEWIIVNPNNATHPFHVHANPFVVKEVGSRFAYTPSASSPLDMLQQMKTITTRDVWRDTVIVPPLGFARIWTKFHARDDVDLTGKTVYHCHFLAHEDTGMVANLMILPPLR